MNRPRIPPEEFEMRTTQVRAGFNVLLEKERDCDVWLSALTMTIAELCIMDKDPKKFPDKVHKQLKSWVDQLMRSSK